MQQQNHSNENPVKIGWVLRDMMQSTGIWTFETGHIQQLTEQAIQTGFGSLEIGGGQSYQISLQRGYNPYSILRVARDTVATHNASLPLQVLLRGANQLGFKHYPESLQRKNIDLLVAAGSHTSKHNALIIRNFDALNDAENLRFSITYMVQKDLEAARLNDKAIANGETPTAKRLHVQAALSYVRPQDSDESSCYSTRYYVQYAQKLIHIAAEAGGQLDSLCIKDMSGQLAPDAAKALVPALKSLGLPVFLHCHSTDEAKATSTQLMAVESGIDGIEVAVAPLSGGTSHNNVRNLCYSDHVQALDLEKLPALEETLHHIFEEQLSSRQDLSISLGALKRMVAIGIPGGAIPFILHDLSSQICGMLSVSVEQALDLFEAEIKTIQQLLGHVPLVTPTADIVAKQAINNLANNVRPEAYRVIDPRFCSLVLGHYGNVNNYASDNVIQPAPSLVNDINQYCEAITPNAEGHRFHSGAVYPNPGRLTEHPAGKAVEEDYDLIHDYVHELFKRYPRSCANFGSEDECFVLHVMRPAGKTDRLLTHNILGPTEDRLRIILEDTLHLLPGNDVPESRDRQADESTDQLLLDALGDYDGIVGTIKDLVLTGTKDSIRTRLTEKMRHIIDPICEVNEDAANHRYYVERRFVSLFASAVFWDLQRICRRTGNDSRSGLDERTAFKLERIIAFTLRKRHIEGRGQAQRFLS